MISMQWHLYHSNEQSGPYGDEDFFRMGREGKIVSTDFVWNSTMTDWTPAGQVEGLLGQSVVATPQANKQNSSAKEMILQELLAYSDSGPFKISRGSDTDLLISNEVVDSSWFSGKKKVTYSAQLLLKEEEKTAYFWEMLKETSSGLSFSVGFEKKKIKGVEVFKQAREKGFSPAGEPVYDYQFDYGSLREAFKQLIQARGWNFKVVLLRGKAAY
jgi:hypothetical protein